MTQLQVIHVALFGESMIAIRSHSLCALCRLPNAGCGQHLPLVSSQPLLEEHLFSKPYPCCRASLGDL